MVLCVCAKAVTTDKSSPTLDMTTHQRHCRPDGTHDRSLLIQRFCAGLARYHRPGRLVCCWTIVRGLGLSFILSASLIHAEPAATSKQARSAAQQLQMLFDEQWEYEMRTHPEFATAVGDNRYNDRLDEESAEAIQAELEQSQKFLARFEAIDPATLSEQDKLSRELMIRELRLDLEGAKFKNWEMPVNQRGGPHLNFPDLITITPFNTLEDYKNYLSRLHQMARGFDQVVANMRQGMRDDLMPPRYLLEKVAPAADEIANQGGESNVFYKPLEQFPSGIADADQKRLREAVLKTISE